MVRSGYHYFRYVDDIRVFARSEAELERAMVDVIRQTRALGLHVQTGKTQIVRGDGILELVNERQTEFELIDYHLDIGLIGIAEEEIRSVLRDLMSSGNFNERHFRKCLNGLKKARSAAGVQSTLRKLDDLQPWAQSVSEYLRPYARSHVSIKRRLMEFLMDPTETSSSGRSSGSCARWRALLRCRELSSIGAGHAFETLTVIGTAAASTRSS